MKTFNSILVVLIAAILTACSSGVTSDASADLFSIPTDKATVCQLTDIATDIEVVPLTHNEPIGILMQSRVYADKMILNESTDNNTSLLICNRKGEVLKRLSRKGRGPGEYQWISDFIYMPENDWLVVYDRNLYKCFIYTLADFKFLKQIELKQEATETSMHEEGIRSMCQLSEKELLLSVETQTGYLDEKSDEPVFEMKYTLSVLNVESGERRNIEYDEKLGAMGCITRIGDEIVAVASQNNNRLHTLVSISDKGSVEELMQFDYGVMTRPEGMDDKDDGDLMLDEKSGHIYTEYATAPCFVSYTKKEFALWFMNGLGFANMPPLMLYHRTGGGEVMAKQIKVAGLTRKFQPIAYDANNKECWAVVYGPAETWIDKKTEPSPLATEIIEKLNAQSDDNPVLVKFRLKR